MACVLMEMLTRLPPTPNRNNETTRCHVIVAKPMDTMARTYKILAASATFLLPRRVTNHPANGRPAIEPAGSANNTLPRPASLSPSVALMSGMRLAQEAKQRPWVKKKEITPHLIDLFMLNGEERVMGYELWVMSWGGPVVGASGRWPGSGARSYF